MVTYVLLSRLPLYLATEAAVLVRLACIKRTASVRPEPGSNSKCLTISFHYPVVKVQNPYRPRTLRGTDKHNIAPASRCQPIYVRIAGQSLIGPPLIVTRRRNVTPCSDTGPASREARRRGDGDFCITVIPAKAGIQRGEAQKRSLVLHTPPTTTYGSSPSTAGSTSFAKSSIDR